MSSLLDDLKAKLPADYAPVIDQYVPALLAMGRDELWAWVTKITQGKTDEAYKTLLSRLPAGDLLNEWEGVNAGWASANKANAQRLALQREATAAILRVCLAAALALVGL